MESIDAERLRKTFEIVEMLTQLNIANDAAGHPEKTVSELRRRFRRRMRAAKDRH